MPPPFSVGGEHIVSPLSVRTSLRPVCTYENRYCSISFEKFSVLDSYLEKFSVLDSYLIYKYIIM